MTPSPERTREEMPEKITYRTTRLGVQSLDYPLDKYSETAPLIPTMPTEQPKERVVEYIRSDVVAALRRENETLQKLAELRKAAADKWVPCPDHRDKVNGGCYVCENESLRKRVEEGEILAALNTIRLSQTGWEDSEDIMTFNGEPTGATIRRNVEIERWWPELKEKIAKHLAVFLTCKETP